MGRWTSPDAPWETPPQSVTPNVCTQPTPAIPRPRGVEDAAPYGRSLNVGISIVVNRRENSTNLLPPIGSPERGAVAARCAVTEGLRQRGCDADAHRRGWLPRPPGVGERTTSAHPHEMVRGLCPRDRIRVEADVTVRTVGNAVASGHAERPQRKGEREDRLPRGTDVLCRPANGAPGTVRPTARDVTFNNKPTLSVIQRKGRRGRRPLRWLR